MKYDDSSFTLIELLVVVAFIVMFSSFSIGYYNQFTEEKKLENTGKKITSLLDFMRVKTTSGDATMCKGVADSKVNYFSFEVLDSDTYRMNPVCLTGTPAPIKYSNESNVIFPTNIPPTPPFPIVTFFPVTGGSTCTYIYIKSTTLNKCRYIKTSDSGLVKEDACSACNACPATCP